MQRSYVPKRYKHCSLPKNHLQECFFEIPDHELKRQPYPCEPRCLNSMEVLQNYDFIENSFLRTVHVPIVSQIPGPAGPAKACDEDHDIGGW